MTPLNMQMPHFNDNRDWFFEKRFGMFVHWGLYSIRGWHEQLQQRAHTPYDEYTALTRKWNPERFDPDAWLDLMSECGMKYVCLTTKHCDGFCLWDTKQTDYNVMNTPDGRDIVRLLADACHRRNVPLCLYYCCVDWHHPSYPNLGRHHELPEPVPEGVPDLPRYIEYVREQARELCTNYGPIAGFWWDCNVDEFIDPTINDMIRHLQPGAVINDRGYDKGDFGTPERDFDLDPSQPPTMSRPTEACQSISSESWGYRSDEVYYTDRHLIRGIDKYLASGANYLLNVGPAPDGTIPAESADLLRRIGAWYNRAEEALIGVEPISHLIANRDILATRRGNTAYIHLYRDPPTNSVKLRPITVAPLNAILLNTGEPVDFTVDLVPSECQNSTPALRLRNLSVNDCANTVLIVKLEFDSDDWVPSAGTAVGVGDDIGLR